MRRFVLGTAGHVDHGKTTLVRALTGVDTDRLPEEKRRGITIELGFAPWRIPAGDQPGDEEMEVSVIDVPGHRRLVHAMIAGASGMELVLLVVAADEGVMPQTREHLAACELLGIGRAVVAVTKLDRVGREVAELAAEEALELCQGRLRAEAVLCSARSGEGVDELRQVVRAALLELPPPAQGARAAGRRSRLHYPRCRHRGHRTLVEGTLRVGAPLRVVGLDGTLETSARGLHVHDAAVSIAEAPTRLAVNLGGLPLDSVRRGDVVTDDCAVRTSRVLDVLLRAAVPKPGQTASLHLGTARTAARVDPVPDHPELARLRLGRPLPVVGGDRFVLRGADVNGPAGAVIAGGVVLDAAPPPRTRRGPARLTVLQALRAGDARGAALALVAEAAPRPFAPEATEARFAVPAAALRAALDELVKKGELARTRAGACVLKTTVAELARAARDMVAAHHRAHPLDRGMPLETLRTRLAARSSLDVAEDAIKLAAAPKGPKQGDPLVVSGDVVALGGAAASLPAATDGALAAAAAALAVAELRGVTEFAVREAAGCTPRDVKAILARLVRDGAAVHVGDLWFARGAYDALRARVVAHLDAQPRMTIAEFKALSGLGRRQAIPLLELLDREGITKRAGDDRVRPG
ncbi:MAG: SelB C-terminal domain-containing protein [Polyangiaceae bacterium]